MVAIARTKRRLGALFTPFAVTLNILVVGCHGSVFSSSTSLSSRGMFSSSFGSTEQRSRVLDLEEGEGEVIRSITIALSAWHPDISDISDAEGPILGALQLFLCDETGLIVVDDTYNTVCMPSSEAVSTFSRSSGEGSGDTNRTGSSVSSTSTFIEHFLSSVDPGNSYLASDPISIAVSDEHQGGFHWTTWRVAYEVIQIGQIFVEQAKMVNVSVAETYMQDVTQLALDVSIMEGIMDRRLDGTGIVMSPVGNEFQTFEATSSEVQQDEVDDVDESTSAYDYKNVAAILRYIGVAMLVINVAAVVLLTHLARSRRLAKEQSLRNAERELDESKGLVTEQGVNLMLDIGRKESEKVLSRGASSKLVSDGSCSTELNSVYIGVKSLEPEKEGRTQQDLEFGDRSDKLRTKAHRNKLSSAVEGLKSATSM
jgi:hypothetical protein